MTKSESIKIFDDRSIRSLWDEEQEEWCFSIVDVIAVLTDSVNPRKYWSVLKTRLKKEGSQLATNCSQLKMSAADGKKYKGLKKENLRDNMTNKELVLNMLAEISTKEISEVTNPNTFPEHKEVAKHGGEVARNARLELEAKTGKKVVSALNAKDGVMLSAAEELEDE